ncbi:MAG: 4-hydroxythreonine-4-phosphate dehydrogenase PdxA [Ignavibacteria bacterium]|nr:4-hydroxythreonine-4-phosphate dehydrogenase PdxA [Ignavibacteria bacterium]
MKSGIIFTIGDANGIGPEIILKIYNQTNYFSKYNLKLITPVKVTDFYADLLKLKPVPPEYLIELPCPTGFKIQPGKINKTAGKISGDAITKSVEMYKNNLCSGIVTLPISKKSLILGGYNFHGHTEFLEYLMHKKNNAMIMYHRDLICLPVTTHIPLKKVSKIINTKLLITKINYLNEFIKSLKKIRKPRLAVLSLNPHAGEEGEIGCEENVLINPVINNLKKKSYNIKGAFPSDGFFGNKLYKKFDGVIGMYHDQIMIPFKLISGGKGVNYTAGIDLIRTSPAHGTAFDIAGMNMAKTDSTIEALKLAVKMAKHN